MEDTFPLDLIRAADGYVHATLMCKGAGKLWADFYRLGKTKVFLRALTEELMTPQGALVQCSQGRGTWVHPRVATDLAQWISIAFSVKLTGWLEVAKEAIPSIQAEYEEALQDLYPDGSNQVEREVRQRLLAELGGQECVPGKFGEIDLVSPEEVIEVKWAPKYAHALGQVLGHAESYPEKGRRVHLFGSEEECSDEKMALVATLLSKYDVKLTYEAVALM